METLFVCMKPGFDNASIWLSLRYVGLGVLGSRHAENEIDETKAKQKRTKLEN